MDALHEDPCVIAAHLECNWLIYLLGLKILLTVVVEVDDTYVMPNTPFP